MNKLFIVELYVLLQMLMICIDMYNNDVGKRFMK